VEAFSIFGLMGFIMAIVVMTQVSTCERKIRETQDSVRRLDKKIPKGENDLEDMGKYVTNFIGENCEIYTYDDQLHKGTLVSVESGWVHLQDQKASILIKTEDISCIKIKHKKD